MLHDKHGPEQCLPFHHGPHFTSLFFEVLVEGFPVPVFSYALLTDLSPPHIYKSSESGPSLLVEVGVCGDILFG